VDNFSKCPTGLNVQISHLDRNVIKIPVNFRRKVLSSFPLVRLLADGC